MRRREFLGALGGAAASQFVARASKPSKIHIVFTFDDCHPVQYGLVDILERRAGRT
jgi:hypothetical protein